MLFKQHDKSSLLNSTHYATLYPQNGDRIVAVDFVTSIHPVYKLRLALAAMWPKMQYSFCITNALSLTVT